MRRDILFWLLGVPIPIIILLTLFWGVEKSPLENNWLSAKMPFKIP